MKITIPWLQNKIVSCEVLTQTKSATPPACSIVVASFNRLAHLPQLIDSIEKQQHAPHYEVIIVDDASTAGDIIQTKQFCSDHNVTLIRLEKNSGSEALPQNVGAYFSQSNVLFYIDSDDYLCSPHAIGHMYKSMMQNEHAICAVSNCIFQIETDTLPDELAWIDEEAEFHPIKSSQMRFTDQVHRYKIRKARTYSLFDLMVYAYAIGLRGFKKNALIAVGGWPLELGAHDDYGLLLALAAACHIHKSSQMIAVDVDAYAYRITGTQSSIEKDTQYQQQRTFLLQVLHRTHISYEQLRQASSEQEKRGAVSILQRWNIQPKELLL